MRANQISVTVSISTLVLALVATPPARGEENQPHKLGDHPAVVVQRLYKTAGYDYASKFYPHPAWMYLRPAQPKDVAPPADVASATRQPPAQLPVAGADASVEHH